MTENIPSLPPPRLTVLLAEDDLDDQELLQDAFSSIDPAIQLYSFSSGKKFLNHLENFKALPDLLILDYNIPEMNGAEILRQINTQEQFKNVTKIVWSTSNSPFYMNTCLELGAQAYFVKPSTLAGLTQVARTMLSYVAK